MKEFMVIVEMNDGEEVVVEIIASCTADAISKVRENFIGYQVADIFVEG